jgi:transcriptional antiterminator RfaH
VAKLCPADDLKINFFYSFPNGPNPDYCSKFSEGVKQLEFQSSLQPSSERNWYVAYTCTRHEKYLARQCEQRGITAFLPLYAVQRQWKKRGARVLLPLFPSYVFVQMALAERFKILALPGLVSLVSFKGLPTVVPDAQIDALKQAVALGRAEPCAYLQSGKGVRVTAGPLVGLEGIVQEVEDNLRVIVSFDWMNRSVSILLQATEVEALR